MHGKFNHRSATLFQALTNDQAGTVLSLEMFLLASVLILGMMAGLTSTRDALMGELSDLAGAAQDLNQSFSINGLTGHTGTTSGSDFLDSLDFCDSVDALAGSADNCIVFSGTSINEGDVLSLSSFILGDRGTLDIGDVDTGRNGSASGTIGDGTTTTGFTVTTNGGSIAGTTGGNEVRFRENPANSGTFTITYDEPVTEVELWVRNLANIAGSPENLLGNFTVTLSDGTVINNAPFTVLPDAISENQNYGLFRTRNNDNSRLTTVTRGGAQYVTDPAANGSGDQAAGRIVFPSVPAVGTPPGPGAVGIQSITFERSGGRNGYQANFSTSGRVLSDTAP